MESYVQRLLDELKQWRDTVIAYGLQDKVNMALFKDVPDSTETPGKLLSTLHPIEVSVPEKIPVILPTPTPLQKFACQV